MSDDYLWDRSGEPDPEIQRLENALGGLRHQSRRLAPPVARPRRQFFPALAAAAAVLLVVGLGAWLSLRHSVDDETGRPRLVIARPVPYLLAGVRWPAPTSFPVTMKANTPDQAALLSSTQAVPLKTARRVIEERRAAASIPDVRTTARRRSSDRQVDREGEMAKDQLMLALRFASSKLNLVQRKIRVNKENGPAS